jgi:hypothetical protein
MPGSRAHYRGLPATPDLLLSAAAGGFKEIVADYGPKRSRGGDNFYFLLRLPCGDVLLEQCFLDEKYP